MAIDPRRAGLASNADHWLRVPVAVWGRVLPVRRATPRRLGRAPRWEADSNFVAVTAGTRVLPQSLEDSFTALRATFD